MALVTCNTSTYIKALADFMESHEDLITERCLGIGKPLEYVFAGMVIFARQHEGVYEFDYDVVDAVCA